MRVKACIGSLFTDMGLLNWVSVNAWRLLIASVLRALPTFGYRALIAIMYPGLCRLACNENRLTPERVEQHN